MSDQTRGAEGNPSDASRSATPPVSEWVDDQPESRETFLRLMELQHKQPTRFFDAMDATRTETKRAVLTALVKNNGATDYDDIERYAHVSRRSIRNHVAGLEEDGLVERVNSTYYAITFADDDAQALAQHALTLYYEQR